jgi:fructose-1,6-bisphosphatase
LDVDAKLERLYESEGLSFLSEETKAEASVMEQRRKLLDEKEAA